ncbi:MAG: hypothetical protein L3J74_05810 [Bacteroidales bacterium]|nr:hypothetical protein [Bacteroidales bacterium]
MKNIYHKFIKFGIPTLVFILMLFAVLLGKKYPGDAEFGAWGAEERLIFLLSAGLAVYFIAAIIIIVIKKNYLYITSWALSILAVIVFLFGFTLFNKIKQDISKAKFEKDRIENKKSFKKQELSLKPLTGLYF